MSQYVDMSAEADKRGAIALVFGPRGSGVACVRSGVWC